MTALLDVINLQKIYPVGGGGKARGQLHAVDDVSFSIAPGETVGLVGESGCGKSTLVRLLARLHDPTAGAIHFGDTDLAGMKARGFARRPERAAIQMVFQDAGESINPRYTAFEAIAAPLRRLRGLRGTALQQRVEELADATGIPRALLGRFPHQLSGGQKARVGIARAIAVEPRLLILDEPTAALDVSVQVVILKLLMDLRQRLGLSYLFVSHDINVVRLICDRVIVMYLGKIVEQGPTAEVLGRPAHPYTRALLSAVPELTLEPPGPRPRLGGEPRSPINPDPKVCRFFGRCPDGRPACADSMPRLSPVGPGHLAACHFA
ncbi:MAG: ABC transporter ATP-binding protein [Alphaproteobacteria bacterium]|jgi:oligopeptide/dipeptide ABC transporter ATP-binding protein|nr:ABC transporter ATP-binding protein [Alphaproteobacteria bacterium]